MSEELPFGTLIDATPHECPYLPDRTAVLPLRYYHRNPTPEQFDGLLAASDRRTGRALYRPSCPGCTECQGIRVPVAEFQPSKSQKKAWKRNSDLQVMAGPPVVDDAHLDLFNRHKVERELGSAITTDQYRGWLANTCARTVETRYLLGDKLLGVGILDLGKVSASSVYFYFDPSEAERSLGVFSVLAEIAWLKRQGFQWYYLGLYVRDCSHLSYKARYQPNERLIEGRWVRGA